jgi:ABC-type transport system involved in multi-copper enzyme maturation permease subunit
MNAVIAIARKEVRDAATGRWLIVYASMFAILALGLSYLAQRNLGGLGFENFSRTTASLLNLCLLLTPLVALSLGAGGIAGERDRGNLTYLLSQPLSRLDLLLGKFTGLVVAIGVATIVGFGAAGMVIATFASSIDVSTYVFLLLLVLALTAVMTGIGLLSSVASASRVQALGVAMIVWFFTVLFFDLILIGLVSEASLGGGGLLAALLLNPVEIVRVLAIIHLEPDLEVLGPFGSYLLETLGTTGATVVLSTALAVWAVVPIALAAWLFARREV